MAESIDSMRRATVEVVEIQTGDIEPDPENPNTVNEKLMATLRADILERGFVQPVLVRPYKGHYRIIDGEHRWRILKEAGAETVPCVVDDAGEDDARLRLLTMNRLRGEFAPVKLAKVLAKLAEQLDEDELAERLGMEEDEYESLRAVETAGQDVDERLAAALVQEAQAAPEVMTWSFDPEQAAQIEACIAAEIEAGRTSRADALIALLKQHDALNK